MQVTRDYDEEEQGYDSEKEREAKDSDDSGSSPARYEADGDSTKHTPKQAKQNGDDHNEEQDMDVSDWDPSRDRMNFKWRVSWFDLPSRLCLL